MATDRPHMIGSPGFSPSLKYEIKLIESITQSGTDNDAPTVKRVKSCFEVLDDLLPSLGVFQHVMKMVRDEMYTAIFSKELTSGHKESGKYLSRVPYFTVALKWLNKRDGQVASLESELTNLKEEYVKELTLKEKHQTELLSCQEALEASEKERATLHGQVEDLRRALKDKEQEMSDKLREQEQKMFDQEFQLCKQESESKRAKDVIENLAPFKKTYDNLQLKFSEPRSKPSQNKASTVNVALSKKIQLQSSLRNALNTQKQLQQMQNSLINDYEALLLKHASGLASTSAVDVHMMVIAKQKDFKQSIGELSNELGLLKTHILQLQDHLEVLKGVNEKDDPLIAMGNPNHPNNPLHSQEQIMNKYAAVVSCSIDSAKTFLPLQNIEWCKSCGAQTLYCPHKQFQEALIVSIPQSTTHIKLARPHLTTYKKNIEQPLILPEATSALQTVPGYDQPNFTAMWDIFWKEFPLMNGLPRQLTLDHLLSLIELFYASLLAKDKYVCTEDTALDTPNSTLMNLFIDFLHQRYAGVTQVVGCALYDILRALEQNYSNHKHILLFAQQLCGYIDSSSFRYMLLLSELCYECLPWNSYRDFEILAQVLYPHLEDEYIEDLVVEVNSFSESSISPKSVVDYLVTLLLRDQDPKVLKMNQKLLEGPVREVGYMSETEYLMALDKLAPGTPDRLRHHLFVQALNGHQHDHMVSEQGGVTEDQVGVARHQGSARDSMSIESLSYVTAYLSVLQDLPVLREKCSQLVDVTIASGRIPKRDLIVTSCHDCLHRTWQFVGALETNLYGISLCDYLAINHETWPNWEVPKYLYSQQNVLAKAWTLKNQSTNFHRREENGN